MNEAGVTPGYFSHVRPELLARVPIEARDVMDVGCGTGRLGEAIKKRQNSRVVGLELNADAASEARMRLDDVLVGDVEAISWHFAPASFDAIICGDVLEHLHDPLAFLKRVGELLRSEGRLIASIPNVRHHSVLRSLLEGNWTYETAGLLDQTHLRFFTRREIEKLMYHAGFAIVGLAFVPGPGDDKWLAQGRPRNVAVGRLAIGPLAPEVAEEFFAYQYLVEARLARSFNPALTSIVVLTHNQLAYTHNCLDSLRFRSNEPWELIVVDNASTDGTVEYLKCLVTNDNRVRAIFNNSNKGVPAGCNQAFDLVRGKQVLLLNNDTILTTGSFKRMLAALYSSPSIGLVGPRSNCVSGAQQISVDYDDLAQLDGFAWDYAKAHAGEIVTTDRLSSFCLLMRREVVDRVGSLDERFGIGGYEDDDYCRRSIAAGFQTVIAADAFVHHTGSATFRGAGIDRAELLRRNESLYRQKWAERTL